MNYSSSSIPFYCDSPEFLLESLHIVTAISTPIHFLGFYFILFKTPEQMKSVKWGLINLQFWIILFDYSLGLLTVPYLLLPIIAGFPLGLLQQIGVPIIYQTLMVLLFLGYASISMISVFENRFHIFCTFPGKHYWSFWRRPWLAAHYIGWLLFLFTLIALVPDQKIARDHLFQNAPFLPDYIHQAPVFILALDYSYVVTVIVLALFLTAFQLIFFIGYVFLNTVQQMRKIRISLKTFQIQKQFSIALIIQLGLPLLMIGLPLVSGWMSVMFNYYNQSMINIAMIIGSMHGGFSTFVMILVHRPYRHSFFELIGIPKNFYLLHKRKSYVATVCTV